MEPHEIPAFAGMTAMGQGAQDVPSATPLRPPRLCANKLFFVAPLRRRANKKGRTQGPGLLKTQNRTGPYSTSPAVWSNPAMMLRFCTAAPAAPLPRLSSVATSRA